MKNFVLTVVIGVVFTISAYGAQGATYFVAPGGDDTASGSVEKPWATLQHAVDTIAAGDTIILKAGTYAGCRIRKGGTAEGPKALRAEKQLVAVVDKKGPLNRKNANIEIDADNYTDAIGYWVIDGLEVKNSTTTGVKALNAPHLEFTNNWCHDNGSVLGSPGHDGIYAVAPNALITGNKFNGNKEHGSYLGQGCMDHVVLRGNVSYDNNNMGFHNNGDKGAPFDTDGMLNYWTIERNIAYNTATSHGMDGDGMAQSVIRNNLFYNVGNSGIMFTGIGGAEVSHDNRVLNNTVVSKNNWAFQVYESGGPNNKLFNNILLCTGELGSISLATTAAKVGFESDYNVVKDRFSLAEETKTLAQWKELGYDAHSIIATPEQLFVNPAADFHLAEGAPAIDAGTTLTDVTDDLEGAARPQGKAYDIGCYERH